MLSWASQFIPPAEGVALMKNLQWPPPAVLCVGLCGKQMAAELLPYLHSVKVCVAKTVQVHLFNTSQFFVAYRQWIPEGIEQAVFQSCAFKMSLKKLKHLPFPVAKTPFT